MMPNLHEVSVPLRFWVRPHHIDEWAKSTRLFFVLGMGRSGTSFFANLLDSDPHSYVVHEPVQRDFSAYQDAFHSPEKADLYIRRFRGKEMFLRASGRGVSTYGEVNSTMRRHVHALRRIFPNARYLHLVRDGRDVVRSMMARATMTTLPRDCWTPAM